MKNSTKIIRWYFAICANTFSRETSSLLQKFFCTLVFKKNPSFGLSSVIRAQYFSNPGPSGSPYPWSTFVKVIRWIHLLSTLSIVCISCHSCRQLVSAVKACVSCQCYTFWPINVHTYDLALVLVQLTVTIKVVFWAKSVNNFAASLCIKGEGKRQSILYSCKICLLEEGTKYFRIIALTYFPRPPFPPTCWSTHSCQLELVRKPLSHCCAMMMMVEVSM